MKLVELLERASQGYPDEYLRENYDRTTGERKRGSGDTLAEFIVVELSETFDPEASDEEQIVEAVRVLEGAINELQGTIAALEP
ncbi:MAG TPA: hypothetical protein VJQ82_17885 [Terriglobales bacterium]|nr:hypothetical protein [Terriglobales bacterium]